MSWDDFVEDYQDAVDEISLSDHKHFSARMRSFFALLDGKNGVRQLVAELEERVDFPNWYEEGTTQRGMAGSGRMDWSEDPRTRLGQELALFRHLGEYSDEVVQFGYSTIVGASNVNDVVSEINTRLFYPFAHRFLKFIKRNIIPKEGADPLAGLEDVILLDKSRDEYKQARKDLIELRQAIQDSNQLGENDPNERSRILTELDAASVLLDGEDVRKAVLQEVLIKRLQWLVEKFVEGTISGIAARLLGALITFIPF